MTEYAHPETIVETSWLAEHAKDTKTRKVLAFVHFAPFVVI